jgi:hypothetical protein
MKKYLWTTIALLGGGCAEIVEVRIPDERPRLVLNSFFNPDSVWNAKITLSHHVLFNDTLPYIENATVIVYDGAAAVDTMNYRGRGYYRSNTGRPKKNTRYSIRATVPGNNAVEANSWCPPVVPVMYSQLRKDLDQGGKPIHSFVLTLSDPPGNNFYEIIATGEYLNRNPATGEEFIYRYNATIWSDDLALDSEKTTNNTGIIFSDVLFEGQPFSIDLKVSTHNWELLSGSKLHIALRSVSEDYYRYKITSLLQDYTRDDPETQPVRVYNNIEDGLGIFAGYSQSLFVYQE